MKRLVSLLLIFVFVVSFAGCQTVESISLYATQILNLFSSSTDWDNEIAVELTDIGSNTKYYFNRLSNREKHAYNNILEQVNYLPEKIEIPMLDSESLTTVYESLLFDNPMLIQLDRSCNIVSIGKESFFTTEYVLSQEEYISKTSEIQEAVDSILSTMPENLSDYEKELYIHNEIIKRCSYKNDNNPDESTVYGALVNGYAACEGYSKSAKLLLDMCGIEAFVLAGKSINSKGDVEGHMWNVVNINGDYYHLDLTWDDPVTQEKSERPRHTFFNLTDEEISKTHSDFEMIYECNATEENYFKKEGLHFDKYSDEVRSKISQLIAENINANKKNIEIRFSSKKVYESAISGLFDKGEVYRILSVADISTEANMNTTETSYIKNDDFYVIDIFLIYK
ncbi:MAG TPA: transglutaminase domain-containing protein [Clostridia bacterium]|nr:transglutaminase domain-containing protein [Clostridia bacterium]